MTVYGGFMARYQVVETEMISVSTAVKSWHPINKPNGVSPAIVWAIKKG